MLHSQENRLGLKFQSRCYVWFIARNLSKKRSKPGLGSQHCRLET
jgi:hypothetical protein